MNDERLMNLHQFWLCFLLHYSSLVLFSIQFQFLAKLADSHQIRTSSKNGSTVFGNSSSWMSQNKAGGSSLFSVTPSQITKFMEADQLWKRGIDVLGHGTYVAGLIGSQFDCLGFAPNAELHIYKVFTGHQVSYTSWFLDAFNHAIMRGLDVVNLSIGGPDFTDEPFMDKVLELTANGVVLVSAIGNDGPTYGTVNNPADQLDVVAIGGIDWMGRMAKFSSRGMTTWELPTGYGRVKPDVVTYGSNVIGLSTVSGEACRSLSGTSVASPVVTGLIALLLSGVRANVGSVKQCLWAGARRLTTDNGQGGPNMFEQGFGSVSLLNTYDCLQRYKPQISLSPPYLDMTECPYMWPYCSQPLFFTGQPIVVNVTLISGMGVLGRVEGEPRWHPHSNQNGSLVRVGIEYKPVVWPWSTWMAIRISVAENGSHFEGLASGEIRVTVKSSSSDLESSVVFPMKFQIVPRPPKEKRLVWDQFHQLGYPPGYFPKDDLSLKKEPLDWNGDHVHTNFKGLYDHLRRKGYYIDVLGQPYTCLDATLYGGMLIVDPEESFYGEELRKLYRDVQRHNLGLLIVGDWFNSLIMNKIKFMDDNSKSLWNPQTGGSNLPQLNRLLSHWNVTLTDQVLYGQIPFGKDFKGSSLVHIAVFLDAPSLFDYASGAGIAVQDSNAQILQASLYDQKDEILNRRSKKDVKSVHAIVLALLSTVPVAVFGDSNCLDSFRNKNDCFWLVDSLLDFIIHNKLNPDSTLAENLVKNSGEALRKLSETARQNHVPANTDNHHQRQSKVERHPQLPQCQSVRFAPPIPIVASGASLLSKSNSMNNLRKAYQHAPLKFHSNAKHDSILPRAPIEDTIDSNSYSSNDNDNNIGNPIRIFPTSVRYLISSIIRMDWKLFAVLMGIVIFGIWWCFRIRRHHKRPLISLQRTLRRWKRRFWPGSASGSTSSISPIRLSSSRRSLALSDI